MKKSFYNDFTEVTLQINKKLFELNKLNLQRQELLAKIEYTPHPEFYNETLLLESKYETLLIAINDLKTKVAQLKSN